MVLGWASDHDPPVFTTCVLCTVPCGLPCLWSALSSACGEQDIMHLATYRFVFPDEADESCMSFNQPCNQLVSHSPGQVAVQIQLTFLKCLLCARCVLWLEPAKDQ
jgi:hypothetical protein